MTEDSLYFPILTYYTFASIKGNKFFQALDLAWKKQGRPLVYISYTDICKEIIFLLIKSGAHCWGSFLGCEIILQFIKIYKKHVMPLQLSLNPQHQSHIFWEKLAM